MKPLLLLCLLLLTSPVIAEDLLDKAAAALRNSQYKQANQYARKAWNSKKTLYSSYLLASGYYHLRVKDSAAFFARTALSDKTIKQDVLLKENQIATLKKILVCCAPHDEAGQHAKTYYYTYKQKTDWYMLSGNRSKGDPPKWLMRMLERRLWKEYQDTLKQKDVSETVLLELRTMRKRNELVDADTLETEKIMNDTISITWTTGDSIHEKTYFPAQYPYLYESRALLIYPMLILYKDFLAGTIDQSNYYVEHFGLNDKTIEPFLTRVFPQIIQNTTNLDDWIQKYE